MTVVLITHLLASHLMSRAGAIRLLSIGGHGAGRPAGSLNRTIKTNLMRSIKKIRFSRLESKVRAVRPLPHSSSWPSPASSFPAFASLPIALSTSVWARRPNFLAPAPLIWWLQIGSTRTITRWARRRTRTQSSAGGCVCRVKHGAPAWDGREAGAEEDGRRRRRLAGSAGARRRGLPTKRIWTVR